MRITWHDRWNDVIRDVLFPDAELKALMLIPDKHINDLRLYVDKYFIEDAMPDALLTDEDVRVIYYETEGTKLNDPHVIRKKLEFDIYVRSQVLYTATNDRLQRRDKLIFQRIKWLLTGTPYVCQLRFTYEDDYHLGAKTAGFKRYHAVFSYKQTH